MTSRLQSAFHDLGNKLSEKLSAKGDAKYFSSKSNRGGFEEIKAGLATCNDEKKIAALKQVIATMSSGRDVTVLFPDVVQCMQTDSVHIKKLVYLYIVHTATQRPTTAILAVNTFVNHCNDWNPLLRALALRTMSSIHLRKIVPYVMEPLKKGLCDSDAYVRRNACIAVAKVFQTSESASLDEGMHGRLLDKIRDENAAVVAAAVASLIDIEAVNGVAFEVKRDHVPRMLEALSCCSEWGQIAILEGLLNYEPRSTKEAIAILERTNPRLQHANAGLVIMAVRIILKFLPYAKFSEEEETAYYSKITQHFVSLISLENEIQFVALRCICILQSAYPNKFNFDLSHFYCPFNVPPYIKKAKLEASISHVKLTNVQDVVEELNDYAQDVDVNLARYSVTSLGRIAAHFASYTQQEFLTAGITVTESAKNPITIQCVEILLKHVKAERMDVTEEALKALRDISRFYVSSEIMETVLKCLPQIRETSALSSAGWIIGMHGKHISKPLTVFESAFQHELKDYNPSEQHAMLACILRLYLNHQDEMKTRLQSVLTEALDSSPDIREKAIIYLRIMATKPEMLGKILLSSMQVPNKVPLRVEISQTEATAKAMKLGCVSSLYDVPFATTYHRLLRSNNSDACSMSASDDVENLIGEPIKGDTTRSKASNSSSKRVDGHSANSTAGGANKDASHVSFFLPDGVPIKKAEYVELWRTNGEYSQFVFGKCNPLPLTYSQLNDVSRIMNLLFIRDKRESTYDAVYFCGIRPNKEVILVEIDIQKGKGSGIKLVVRGPTSGESKCCLEYIKSSLAGHIPNIEWN